MFHFTCARWCTRLRVFLTLHMSRPRTRAASRSGAPQASLDKRSRRPGWHRNCFHNKSSQAIDHFTCIFKKVNISWGQRSVGAIICLHRPQLQKKHSRRSEFTPELRRWISKLTTSNLQILDQEIFCRFCTNFSKSFDHHGKPKKKWLKIVSKKWKKPELPQTSVSNFDQDVFDNALDDAFVKVANVKSVKNFAWTHRATHKSTSAQRLKVTMVTPDNCPWSP